MAKYDATQIAQWDNQIVDYKYQIFQLVIKSLIDPV